MTIDERLEALTRNLELMILETGNHDRQIAALGSHSENYDRQLAALLNQSASQDGRLERRRERLDALTQSLQLLALESEKHDRQIEQATRLVTDVAEGTARLLRIAERHETRLDSHDDRLDQMQ